MSPSYRGSYQHTQRTKREKVQAMFEKARLFFFFKLPNGNRKFSENVLNGNGYLIIKFPIHKVTQADQTKILFIGVVT